MNNILFYKVEGKTFKTTEQYITGAELKRQGGIPLDVELYLAIKKPFEDELIENDTRVNLARPEIEQFFVKKKLYYFINEKEYISYKQWISGAEIREKGNISDAEDLYLKVDTGWEDDFILDDEVIDLARPGKEHFYTKERVGVMIFVNTKGFDWKRKWITYEEVVSLAFTTPNPSVAYTVAYSKGHASKEEGFMVAGQKVVVKHNMEFDVTATHKS
ncbi:multiubiquitin domain-containing protein [Butyricimonas hominis]|uniref:multiubiquitin domain-containing protein n=1 Tax=Butyricimonas TaxID=574697 RepID=UPI003511F855